MFDRGRSEPLKTKTHLFLLAACVCGLLTGCLGDKTLEEVDPEAAPTEPTFSRDIEPLMEDYCVACHAVDALPGEVGDIGLDTCEKVKENMEIVSEMVFDREVMPPGGAMRLTEEEQLTLKRWFDQGADCND